MKPHRIPQLDGLRGIALIMVVTWHCFAGLIRIPPEFPFQWSGEIAVGTLQMGWSGVDLFFVLSGFLIGGILWDNREARNYYRVFYERRFWRIVPPYLIWLGLMPIVGAVAAGRIPEQVHSKMFDLNVPIWTLLTFTQNLPQSLYGIRIPGWVGVTWSLATEEQFYLTIPLLVRLVPKHRLITVVSGLALASMIARITLRLTGLVRPSFGYMMVIARADSLLIGVLCALLMRTEIAQARIRQHRKALYVMAGMLLIGVQVLTRFSPAYYTVPAQAFGYIWYALLYALIMLIALTEERGPIRWVTSLPVLRWIGVRAYSIYLSHFGIFLVAHAWITQRADFQGDALSWAISIGSVALSVALAWVSWEVLEKRMIARGNRQVYEPPAQSQMQPVTEIPVP